MELTVSNRLWFSAFILVLRRTFNWNSFFETSQSKLFMYSLIQLWWHLSFENFHSEIKKTALEATRFKNEVQRLKKLLEQKRHNFESFLHSLFCHFQKMLSFFLASSLFCHSKLARYEKNWLFYCSRICIKSECIVNARVVGSEAEKLMMQMWMLMLGAVI